MTLPPTRRLDRLAAAALASLLALAPLSALANHDVLVEGEEDFDGDGNVGTAENTDGDQVFGTITAALAGGNRNVTIVTSGRFAESLDISAASTVPGNLKLTAAPGVEAVIGAVLAGPDPRGALFNAGGATNDTRQALPGISVNLPADQRVILCNLTITNWSTGISIRNNSHVLVENCRISNNKDFGIFVGEQAVATILHTKVSTTGYRLGTAGMSPNPDVPAPGDGVFLDGDSTAALAHSAFIGNFRNGVTNQAGKKKAVMATNLIGFDNGGEDFDNLKVKN